MNSLHKVMVIGASLGLHGQIASLFPERKPEKTLSEHDNAAINKAEAKRQRRQSRNQRAQENSND